MNTAVKKVLETEKKADDLIARAHKEKEKILEQARREALALISEGQTKIDEQQDAFLQQQQAETEEKKQRLRDENEQVLNEIERHAGTALKKAEAALLQKFEGVLNE